MSIIEFQADLYYLDLNFIGLLYKLSLVLKNLEKNVLKRLSEKKANFKTSKTFISKSKKNNSCIIMNIGFILIRILPVPFKFHS